MPKKYINFETILCSARSYLQQGNIQVPSFPIKAEVLAKVYRGLSSEDRKKAEENARLAFGGDAFYNSCISNEIRSRLPTASTKQASKLKDVLVSNELMNEIIMKMEHSEFITRPNRKKRKRCSGGGKRDKAGGDTFETLVELYMRQVGPDIARFFLTTVLDEVIDACIDACTKSKKSITVPFNSGFNDPEGTNDSLDNEDGDDKRPKKKRKLDKNPHDVAPSAVNNTTLPPSSGSTFSPPQCSFTFVSEPPLRRRNLSSPPVFMGIALQASIFPNSVVSSFPKAHRTSSYFAAMTS